MASHCPCRLCKTYSLHIKFHLKRIHTSSFGRTRLCICILCFWIFFYDFINIKQSIPIHSNSNKVTPDHGNEIVVYNNSTWKRKMLVSRCKKAVNAKRLLIDKEDYSKQITITFFNPTLINIIDVNKEDDWQWLIYYSIAVVSAFLPHFVLRNLWMWEN